MKYEEIAQLGWGSIIRVLRGYTLLQWNRSSSGMATENFGECSWREIAKPTRRKVGGKSYMLSKGTYRENVQKAKHRGRCEKGRERCWCSRRKKDEGPNRSINVTEMIEEALDGRSEVVEWREQRRFGK